MQFCGPSSTLWLATWLTFLSAIHRLHFRVLGLRKYYRNNGACIVHWLANGHRPDCDLPDCNGWHHSYVYIQWGRIAHEPYCADRPYDDLRLVREPKRARDPAGRDEHVAVAQFLPGPSYCWDSCEREAGLKSGGYSGREGNSRFVSIRGVPRLASICIVVLFFLSACLPSDPGPRGEVGVSTTGQATVIGVKPCENGAWIQSVALRSSTGRAGKLGQLLWQIRSEQGSLRREYQIGETPTGFVETVALQNLDPNTEYVVEVTLISQELQLLTDFVPGKLRPSMWNVSTDRSLTQDEFQRLRPCG